MKCKRCSVEEVRFRVYSDIINLAVCTSCAIKARILGLKVETLSTMRTDRQIGDNLTSLHP